jgi:Leucine-rich repeat (LRR) protein
MTEAPARLKPLKGEASRIFKLCQEKDRKTALQGLELAAALGATMEGVLEGVTVDAEGQVVRSKRFTGNDKTQPVLDALLLQQLGMAAKGTAEAKLRDAITTLVCKVCVLPDLSAFAGLKSVNITLASEFKGVDVAALGSLSKVTSLTFDTGLILYGQERATLHGFDGLDAPQLQELDARYLHISDIRGLSSCKKLKRVNLQGNVDLTSIDGLKPSAPTLEVLDLGSCIAVASLQPLREATRLRRLDINGLKHITDLSDLKKLTGLKGLDISGCKGLKSLKGLPMKAMSSEMDDDEASPSEYLVLNDMQALTSLQGLPPLAPHITEFMINRAPALTDLTGLEAAAGSVQTLRLDRVPVTDLNALKSLEHLETLKIEMCGALVDASALGELPRLAKILIKNCAKLETLPETWKAPVKVLSLSGCLALKPLKTLPAGLDPKTIEIDDRKLLPRAKPTKALKSDVGAVWKLLSTRDIPNILMGLELSAALGENYDGLVEGVTVKNGTLVRGKRFTGTGPAQPYLDLALFGLMCRAPAGSALSKLRAQITELDLMLCAQAPQLEGFTNLARLTLHISEDSTPDLASFGPMPKLQALKINGRRWNSKGSLVSLQGLQAPALTECNLSCCGLEDLSALQQSPRIQQLDLSENQTLADLRPLAACAPNLVELDLRGCKQLSALDALQTATKLKSLSLRECAGLTSVKPLAGCTSLETLDLEMCASLLAAKKMYDGSQDFSLDGCHALASLAHLPSFGGTLTSLSLDHTRDLKNFKGLREIPTLTHLNARHSGLSDLENLSVLHALARVDLDDCDELKDATPLGSLKHLEVVSLSDSAVTTLPQGWSGPVTHLTLKNCQGLKSLGELPAALVKLVCDGSNSLVRLDGMQACKALEAISAEACKVLADLGTPPATLRELDARGCPSLTSLAGLQVCPLLQTVGIPLSVTDASALQALASVTIRIDLNELGLPAKKGDLMVLHTAFIDAINTLPSVKLELKGPSGSWYSQGTIDLTVFPQFKTLESLNFGDFDFSSKVADMTWLVHLKGLQSVVFYPRGNMSHTLDGGVHDSPKKVKALQLKICQEAKIKPPAHLT